MPSKMFLNKFYIKVFHPLTTEIKKLKQVWRMSESTVEDRAYTTSWPLIRTNNK